jgi:hypothetical protein
MRLTALSFTVCSLLSVAPGYCQEPERLSGPEVSPVVWGVLETPQRLGPHPGVIILPGAAGWRPLYGELARLLADSDGPLVFQWRTDWRC